MLKSLSRHQTKLVKKSLFKSKQFSTNFVLKQEQEILVEEAENAKIVTLNRPKQLNALNLTQVRALFPLYQKWNSQQDPTKVIILKGAGDKAFCAGGDIKEVVEKKETTFFQEEYELNKLIGTHNKCTVALIDGITMGGGVGLSVHGNIRIATEKTMFAMPESAIGFFCDVGGSYFLPRLPGALGMYLALTGDRLKGKQVLAAKIATHFVPSASLNNVVDAIIQANTSDAATISKVIHQTVPESNEDVSGTIKELSQNVEMYFGNKKSVKEIIAALESQKTEFSEKTLKTLRSVSPTSVRVIHRQLNVGKQLGFEQCFDLELTMASEMMRQPDFYEGVRALLVDKDKKFNWKPSKLEDVKRESVDKYFVGFEKYTPSGEDL